MDEIISNSKKLRKLLADKGVLKMSEEEFKEQRRSFIVGNAYDVFADSDTITHKKLRDEEERQLTIAQ
jgi:hypothetical protein